MANILVLMELGPLGLLPVSLEALGQARRVATALGATVYALLPMPDAPAYGEDDLIALCARHGADKVALLTDEGLPAEAETRFGTHGRAVLAACEQLPPVMVLCGATRAARDLAPRVAARLGAAYLPEGWLSADEGRLTLRDRLGRPVLTDEEGPEHVVVMTVPPGRYVPTLGGDEAEMVIVAAAAAQAEFAQVEHRPELALRVAGGDAQGEPSSGAPTLSPSLSLGIGGPAEPAPGALRVAIGPEAAVEQGAHYALCSDDPATALRAILRAAEGS